MPLTGRFTFRRTFWGKIVLQVEEDVRSPWLFWRRDTRRRRWRDATVMDLADVQLRALMDLRHRPLSTWQPSPNLRVAEPPAPVAADKCEPSVVALETPRSDARRGRAAA